MSNPHDMANMAKQTVAAILGMETDYSGPSTYREEDFVDDPQKGPEILQPPRLVHAMMSIGDEPFKIGSTILRTCTTCACFRQRGEDGYCHAIQHFEEHGSPQYIGSFHRIKHGFNPSLCPMARDENGNWCDNESKLFPDGETSSAATTKAEQVQNSSDSGNVERPESAAIPVQGGQENEPSRPPASNTGTPAGFQSSSVVRRSISEPIRDTQGWTTSQIYDSPDRGLILQWERGREVAGGSRKPNTESQTGSGWKAGTDYDTAWQQGFAGQDLFVTPGQRQDVSTPVQLVEPDPSPRTVSRSLF